MNNNPQNKNKVSVRAESGGHSFCIDSLSGEILDGECGVEFCIVTHKTVLVPDEIFETSSAARYLSVAGVPCAGDEEPLCISEGGITAVMAVSERFMADVGRRLGGRASFTSPLLGDCGHNGRRVQIQTLGGVSFFKVGDNGRLRFAEALQTDSADDILYYANALDSRFGLNEYLIYICGDGAETTARLLSKYFSSVKCE